MKSPRNTRAKKKFLFTRLSRKGKLNYANFWHAKSERKMYLSDEATWSDWHVFHAPMEPSCWHSAHLGRNLTTLRSPHVNKNAQEHFRLGSYKSRQTKRCTASLSPTSSFLAGKYPFFQELESSEKRFFKSTKTFSTHF